MVDLVIVDTINNASRYPRLSSKEHFLWFDNAGAECDTELYNAEHWRKLTKYKNFQMNELKESEKKRKTRYKTATWMSTKYKYVLCKHCQKKAGQSNRMAKFLVCSLGFSLSLTTPLSLSSNETNGQTWNAANFVTPKIEMHALHTFIYSFNGFFIFCSFFFSS